MAKTSRGANSSRQSASNRDNGNSWQRHILARKYGLPLSYALMFAGLGSAALMYASAASAVPSGTIVSPSGECLTAKTSELSQDDTLRLRPCGDGAQAWSMQSDQTITLDGKCLDGSGGQFDGFTVARLTTCNQQPSQQWQQGADNTLRNRASDNCLDPRTSASANGSPVTSRTCDGSGAQHWDAPQ